MMTYLVLGVMLVMTGINLYKSVNKFEGEKLF